MAPAPAEAIEEEAGMQRPFHTHEADQEVGKRREFIQVYANILVDAVRRQVWRPQIKMDPTDVDAILVLVHAKGGRSSVSCWETVVSPTRSSIISQGFPVVVLCEHASATLVGNSSRHLPHTRRQGDFCLNL